MPLLSPRFNWNDIKRIWLADQWMSKIPLSGAPEKMQKKSLGDWYPDHGNSFCFKLLAPNRYTLRHLLSLHVEGVDDWRLRCDVGVLGEGWPNTAPTLASFSLTGSWFCSPEWDLDLEPCGHAICLLCNVLAICQISQQFFRNPAYGLTHKWTPQCEHLKEDLCPRQFSTLLFP